MPDPHMPATLKTKEFRTFDLTCCVLRSGLRPKTIITYADNQRWCADFIECGWPQAFAQNRIAAQSRCTT